MVVSSMFFITRYRELSTWEHLKQAQTAEEIKNMALVVGDPSYVNTVNTPECAASSILLTEKLVESAKADGEKIYL